MVGRIREEAKRRRRSEKRKSQKKEDAGAQKGRKVARHCVFPMSCGSRGSKSRLAKAAGAEPQEEMRNQTKRRQALFKVKSVKKNRGSDHFWR